MANFYTLPQDVGASLLVPLGEDQGLGSRPLQLFHDRGYELGGEEDVEVRDRSLLTSFSIDGEYTSDTL
jgi:hypothetical protein